MLLPEPYNQVRNETVEFRPQVLNVAQFSCLTNAIYSFSFARKKIPWDVMYNLLSVAKPFIFTLSIDHPEKREIRKNNNIGDSEENSFVLLWMDFHSCKIFLKTISLGKLSWKHCSGRCFVVSTDCCVNYNHSFWPPQSVSSLQKLLCLFAFLTPHFAVD